MKRELQCLAAVCEREYAELAFSTSAAGMDDVQYPTLSTFNVSPGQKHNREESGHLGHIWGTSAPDKLVLKVARE
jgi:hypothetical protein